MDVRKWIDWRKDINDKGKVLIVFPVLFYLKVIEEKTARWAKYSSISL